MKKAVLLFTIILAGTASFGQSYISFGYDNAGNRLSRTLVIPKSATMETKEEPEIFKDKLEKVNFTLYPNPTKGLLTVDIENLEPGTKANIKLFDLQGRQIYENNNPAASNTIDISNQNAGTYIMVLQAGDKTSEWKIIKE